MGIVHYETCTTGDPMTRNTVRLADLASITGRTRDAIRALQNTGATPWDDEAFPKQGYRRYDGLHALTLVLQEMLTAQGISASQAAEFVNAQLANVERFLNELQTGDMTPRFVAAIYVAEEDDFGTQWLPVVYWGTGTADELMDAFAGELKATSKTVEKRGVAGTVRRIGGPHVSVAPISEAYRLLRHRAEAAGFMVDGRRIFRIEQGEDSE